MFEFVFFASFVWINSLLNSFMDKRKSATTYPEWHKEYSREINFRIRQKDFSISLPHWLWSKFRNKWHVIKQLPFYGTNGVFALWAVKDFEFTLATILFVLIMVGADKLWKWVEPPEWWN